MNSTNISVANSGTWTTDTFEKLPRTAILDLQITMPEYQELYLHEFTVYRDCARVVICDSVGVAVVSGTIRSSDYTKPHSLKSGSGIRAHILLGYVPGPGVYVASRKRISDTCIDVYTTAPNEPVLALLAETDVQRSSTQKESTDTKTPEIIPVSKPLLSINGKRAGSNRTINIDLYYNITAADSTEGGVSPIPATAKGNVVTLDTSERKSYFDPRDIIDDALSPKLADRRHSHYPLDIVFKIGGDGEVVRDVKGTLGLTDDRSEKFTFSRNRITAVESPGLSPTIDEGRKLLREIDNIYG